MKERRGEGGRYFFKVEKEECEGEGKEEEKKEMGSDKVVKEIK